MGACTAFLTLYGDDLDEALGSADRTNLFTVAKRQLEINRAQIWFLTKTSCLAKTWPITMIQAQGEYDLDAIVTDESFLFIDPSQGPRLEMTDASSNTTVLSGESDFPRRTVPWLNTYFPGWQVEPAGMPWCWYERKEGAGSMFGLTDAPNIPAGNTWVVKLPYVQEPVTLVMDADLPFTVAGVTAFSIEPWWDALVFRAASRLELLRKGLDRSQVMEALAQQRVDDYMARTTVVGPQRLQLPRRPDLHGMGRPGFFGPYAPGWRFGRTW